MSNYFDNKDVYIGPKMQQYGSHMIVTDVQKQIQTKYVTIDTRFHDEYNDSFEANYNVTLDEHVNDIRSISVTQMELPVSFFNISDALGNNTFRITEKMTPGQSSKMIRIPDGNYDIQTFEEIMQLQFSAYCSCTVPFSNISFTIVENKVVFDCSSNNNFEIDFGVDKNGDFSKYNFKSRLGWLMGFRQQTVPLTPITPDVTNNGQLIGGATGSAIIDLNGPRYLHLVVDEFNSRVNRSSLARISLNRLQHPFGSIMSANSANGYLESEYRRYFGKNDIYKLNVRLEDEYGRVIDLNGLDFSFQLRIEYE